MAISSGNISENEAMSVATGGKEHAAVKYISQYGPASDPAADDGVEQRAERLRAVLEMLRLDLEPKDYACIAHLIGRLYAEGDKGASLFDDASD